MFGRAIQYFNPVLCAVHGRADNVIHACVEPEKCVAIFTRIDNIHLDQQNTSVGDKPSAGFDFEPQLAAGFIGKDSQGPGKCSADMLYVGFMFGANACQLCSQIVI